MNKVKDCLMIGSYHLEKIEFFYVLSIMRSDPSCTFLVDGGITLLLTV